MTLRLLKTQATRDLYRSVANELDRYRKGEFAYLVDDPSQYFEVDVTSDLSELDGLNGESDNIAEKANCLRVHSALSSVSPYLAKDSRLWAYLTHTRVLPYVRSRWPIPDDDNDAIKHIRRHFFGQGGRGLERDNAISRLWWMAYICSRAKRLSLEEALDAFLHRADVRANIIERPTSSQSVSVLTALLSELGDSFKGDGKLFERRRFRQVMKEINLLGGHILIETLSITELRQIIRRAASTVQNP